MIFPAEDSEADEEIGVLREKLTLFEMIPSIPFEDSRAAEDTEGRAALTGVGVAIFGRPTREISELGVLPN